MYCAAHAYTDEAVRRALECGAGVHRARQLRERTESETLRDEANEGRGGYWSPPWSPTTACEGTGAGMAPELVAKVGDLVERGRETLRTRTRWA